MSQAQTQVNRQLYEITRSEATWLVKNYKNASKKAAVIEPYRVFRDELETQRPAYLGKFNNSRDAAVQGAFYALALHIFDVIERLFKQVANVNHKAKVESLCKHLPTSFEVAYQSIDYLNWAVYNWHHKKEIITEDFADNCLENTTCAICDFTGEEVFYFSTAYGLDQAVCENCVRDEKDSDDVKGDVDYVVEASEAEEEESAEEDASEADASEADASEADASEGEEESAEEASESDDDSDYNVEDDESSDSESDASSNCTEETDLSDSESGDERTFGCSGCPYEWRAGFKHGYKAAMKEIRNYAVDQKHNVPAAPQCEVCDDSHENLQKCGRCKLVRYCSVVCQEEDWPEHKRVCRR